MEKLVPKEAGIESPSGELPGFNAGPGPARCKADNTGFENRPSWKSTKSQYRMRKTEVQPNVGALTLIMVCQLLAG